MIPEDALVLGRIGGYDTFNINYFKDAVKESIKLNKKLYYIFVNTFNFCKGNTPQDQIWLRKRIL